MRPLVLTLLSVPSILAAPAGYFKSSGQDGPYHDFSLSCAHVSLDDRGSILSASCARPIWASSNGNGNNGNNPGNRGSPQAQQMMLDNELDLRMCVGIDQETGELAWDVYGKYTNYCQDCILFRQPAPEHPSQFNHLLSCECAPLVGMDGPVRSSLNLDEGIANEMGTLRCAGGMASLTHPQ